MLWLMALDNNFNQSDHEHVFKPNSNGTVNPYVTWAEDEEIGGYILQLPGDSDSLDVGLMSGRQRYMTSSSYRYMSTWNYKHLTASSHASGFLLDFRDDSRLRLIRRIPNQ